MMSFQNQDSGGISKAVPDKYESVNQVETKMLYLSTKSSQSINLNGNMKSRVMFDLKSYLDFDGDDTIQSITLAMPYAILCNSNYQINATNNVLNVILNSSPITYTFEYGNYASDTFMQMFTTLCGVNGFVISLDQVAVKFTISHPTYPFTILGTTTMDYILGFSGNQVSNYSSAPYITVMPRCCNFLPNPLFRICIENNTFYNGQVLGTNGSPQYSNVLASIPNVTKQNTQIVYQNFSDEFTIQKSGQTTLLLSILDDNGNLVDFNGISSYFQLRLRIYRRLRRRVATFIDLLEGAGELRDIMENSGEVIEKPISSFL